MIKKELIHRFGMKLCNAQGEWIRQGHIIADVHGTTHIVQGGECPAHEPPNGVVYTNKGSHMTQLVNCVWVEMSQSEQDARAVDGVAYN